MNKIFKFFISIIIPILVGFLGSLVTKSSVNNWYLTLNKPSFNPPNWLFAPVWTGLFLLMGISFYIVWNNKVNFNFKDEIYLVYFAQLILNLLWSVLFFGLKSPVFAFVDILLLWIFVFVNIKMFYKVSFLAGLMLVPYILWLSFAVLLNFAIMLLN